MASLQPHRNQRIKIRNRNKQSTIALALYDCEINAEIILHFHFIFQTIFHHCVRNKLCYFSRCVRYDSLYRWHNVESVSTTAGNSFGFVKLDCSLRNHSSASIDRGRKILLRSIEFPALFILAKAFCVDVFFLCCFSWKLSLNFVSGWKMACVSFSFEMWQEKTNKFYR